MGAHCEAVWSPTDSASQSDSGDKIARLLRESNSGKRRRLTCELPTSHERLPREHAKPVVSLDWHSSNSALLLSCSLDGSSRLWDSRSNKSIQRLAPHGGSAISCGQWVTRNSVATGGYDNHVHITDVEKNQTVVSFPHKHFVSALQVHPVDSNLLFTGDYGSTILSWDLRTGKTVKEYRGAGGKILDMVVLQSGNELLASADIVRKNSSSQALRVWELDSGVTLSQQIYAEPYTCPCVQAHPYRNEFYAQSNGNYIVIFSSRKPYKCNKRKRFESHRVDGNKVHFDISSNGRLLCSASADGNVVFYDSDTAHPLHSLQLANSCCVSVAWNKNLSSVIAVSDWSSNITVLK